MLLAVGLLLLREEVQPLLRVLDQVLHGAVQGQREAALVVQADQELCNPAKGQMCNNLN